MRSCKCFYFRSKIRTCNKIWVPGAQKRSSSNCRTVEEFSYFPEKIFRIRGRHQTKVIPKVIFLNICICSNTASTVEYKHGHKKCGRRTSPLLPKMAQVNCLNCFQFGQYNKDRRQPRIFNTPLKPMSAALDQVQEDNLALTLEPPFADCYPTNCGITGHTDLFFDGN